MIYGHGDDAYLYGGKAMTNFSSNCFAEADNTELVRHLNSKTGRLIANYPHPEAAGLKEVIATRFALSTERISVFNGATEAIYNIARDLEKSDSLIVGPTFSEYESAAQLYGHRIRRFHSRELIPFEGACSSSPVWIDELRKEIASLPGDGLIWICNPNNPDGQIFPLPHLRDLIGENPRHTFIIDQSYAPFTSGSVLEMNNPFENVLIIHSLTKQYAIPGLRLGYVTGDESLIRKLDRHKMPWSVNALAIEAGNFLLGREDHFNQTAERLHNEMMRTARRLQEIDGITCYHSDTHYFLARLETGSAASLKERLALEYGLLIRDAGNFAPHYEGHFRIAVKGRQDNERLENAIATIIKNNK